MIGFIVAGLIIGALARLLKPGKQNLGILMTLGLGLVGSVIGGVIANALGTGSIWELNVVGFVVMYALLQRQVGRLGTRRTFAYVLAVALASAIAAAAAWGAWRLVDEALGRSTLGQLAAMVVAQRRQYKRDLLVIGCAAGGFALAFIWLPGHLAVLAAAVLAAVVGAVTER